MEVDDASLEVFRQEWIDGIENARLGALADESIDDKNKSRGLDNQLYRNRETSEASTATLRQTTQSRESTTTMRGISEVRNYRPLSADAMDIEEAGTGRHSVPKSKKSTVIVATDFGTTFSAVAFAKIEDRRLSRVKIVANYPDDPRSLQGRPSLEVKTESWYPDAAQLAELDDREMEMASFDDGESMELYEASEHGEEEQLGEDSAGENDAGESTPPERASRNFYWGYGTDKIMIDPDMDPRQFDRIARFKLLLDTKVHTQQVRDNLQPILNRLKRRRIINEEVDVIADYLTQLFIHAKQQIEDFFDVSDSTAVEHVLCVPVVWTSKALRKMQMAMKCAIEKSSLGTMENLFLVSEPEAAAAYVLDRSDEVDPGEAFLILDAGGGTVDATTYIVHKQYPLRLSQEVVVPDGCLNGSSYLNDDFRRFLLEKLEGETYLEVNGYTIEGIVDRIVFQFEREIKRTIDVTDKNLPIAKLEIHGLRADEKKGFGRNKLFITKSDFRAIFMRHLREIRDLMINQLTAASGAGFRVQKVILIGGFSGSASLRNYLKQQLRNMSSGCGYQIRLIDTMDIGAPETAVAHGGILRAFNKEHGPARKINSSYGFLRSEPYGEWPEHKNVKVFIDKLDGEEYVDNTIDWLVKIGQTVDYHAEYSITSHHLFATTWEDFKCEEILYVSDSCRESHYRRKHPKNRGKYEIAGKIIADMSFLVDEGLIEVIEPDHDGAKPHYKIELELVMIIDGRNLRYEARWPVGGEGEVRSRDQISIAAAFKAGTD